MGLLDRFRRRRPGAASFARDGDPREDLAAEIRALISPGFVSRAEAAGIAKELAEADYPELTAADVTAVVAHTWTSVAATQAAWVDEGDYERLRQAFGELESDGVVARMNFTCCQTCGHDEIGDERSDGAWGYTFFHQQDAERLGPGSSDLYLAFGSLGPLTGIDPELVQRARDGDDAARDEVIARSEVPVARRVVAALERQGLRVAWDGTNRRRIQVSSLDWRKRLPQG